MSTTEEMTLTQALVELKILDSRIAKANSDMSGKLIFFKRGKNNKTGINGVSVEDMSKQAKSLFDSLNGLIKRRFAIKRALVTANSAIKVSVGGKEYTLAEAIEYKSSVAYKEQQLAVMETNYAQVLTAFQRENQKVEDTVNAQIAQAFGNESKSSDASISEAIASYRSNFLDSNAPTLVDPLKLKEAIDRLADEINEFKRDVDVQISIANSTHKLTLSY